MIGRKISKYEVLEKLGEGGMGVVYKARDTELGRAVALKFLPSRLGRTEAQAARFEHEARAISALNHPNIATIYALERAGDERFLALELLPGGTLRSRIPPGGLPLNDVLDYALEIAEGLAHAHRNGIVHRDVKSDNVMFTSEGRLKLTDFGLAKLADSERLTRGGALLGTLAYMSPEQVEGLDADQRADIFSFGIVLYELATGRLPYASTTEASLMREITSAPAPSARQARPELPDGFDRIVAQALERDRDRRYQRVEEVIVDLRNLRSGDALTVTLPPAARKPRRKAATRRRWAGLAAAGLAAALGVFLFLSPSTRRGVPAEKHLAILPFLNVGQEPANQAFSEGLVETLASKLSQLEQFQGSLWVVPTSEIRSRSIRSPEQARKALGVTLALTGSVQRAGDRLRLTVNLVDTRTLRQLRTWAGDPRLENTAALQDAMVGRVAEMLELGVQPGALKTFSVGGTRAPQANDFYLQGQGYLARYDRRENLDTAMLLFEKALQQDPQFVLAQAALAEAQLRKHQATHDRAWLNKAVENARHAVALGGQVAVARATYGLTLNMVGRPRDAVKEFERALEMDPANADACRGLAVAYRELGDLAKAEAAYRRAVELKPRYWGGYNSLGFFLYQQGRYEEAASLFQRVTELTPDNVAGYRNLGGAQVMLDRYDQAAKSFEKALSIQPTASVYSNLGHVYFVQGRNADAIAMNEKAIALDADDYRIRGNLGDCYRFSPDQRAKATEAYHQAIRLAGERLAVNPKDAACRVRMATYLAKNGDARKALVETERARALAPEDPTVLWWSVVVYELAGRREQALKALDGALAKGYSLPEIKREPELAGLRKDRRYLELLSKIPAAGAGRQ